jgi:acetylornithine deacetylase/succinyl-diaminopimelate desuccinylase-like protein
MRRLIRPLVFMGTCIVLAASSAVARAQSAEARRAAARQPDWNAVGDETVRHLRRLIQLNTVNPPGNEITVARYLDSTLRSAGIETHLFEPAPGRAAFVARLKGNGAKQPILLMAHMDVVGVETDQWTVDPFAAVEKDGYVYGRGAIDDKGMLAANLVTMLLLKRNVIDAGGTLQRDVVLVANSDEEAGGDWGMGWLIANKPDLIRAEFALNEGGRTRVVNGRPLYVAVQNTEKVAHNVRVIAKGPGGHASVPLSGNAISRLARAMAKIAAHEEPVRINPTTRVFFSELSAVWPNATERKAMANVASQDQRRIARGARVLSAIPIYNAVLRNGISPTLIDGGIRSNVIPTEATANLNIRTLPTVHRLGGGAPAACGGRQAGVVRGRPGHDRRPRLLVSVADVHRDCRRRANRGLDHRRGAVHEHRCDGQRASARLGCADLRRASVPVGAGGRGAHARQRRARADRELAVRDEGCLSSGDQRRRVRLRRSRMSRSSRESRRLHLDRLDILDILDHLCRS